MCMGVSFPPHFLPEFIAPLSLSMMGFRIHWLYLLQRGKNSTKECDTKLHLMSRLQFEISEEWGGPLYYSQFHSNLEREREREWERERERERESHYKGPINGSNNLFKKCFFFFGTRSNRIGLHAKKTKNKTKTKTKKKTLKKKIQKY